MSFCVPPFSRKRIAIQTDGQILSIAGDRLDIELLALELGGVCASESD
jgi:hypothetical protein